MLPLAAPLAGCGLGDPFVQPEPLPARAAVQTLDLRELAEWVDENVTEADFLEDFDLGLVLDPRGDALFVKGVIDEFSHEEVYDVLRNELRIGTLVFTLVPGSIDDVTNLALGRMLRRAGITTYLPSQGSVESGGTDLFLAGARRIVERGASLGVHSWSMGLIFGRSGASFPRGHPEHEKYLEYYRDMGIPEDFYWFTLEAASPGGMHWMTEEEMERYGVYTDLIP